MEGLEAAPGGRRSAGWYGSTARVTMWNRAAVSSPSNATTAAAHSRLMLPRPA